MRILIIEDEIPSRLNLQRALSTIAPDLHVVGALGSVAEAVEWFNNHPEGVDLIFMDVQLSDGLCFDIFKSTTVKGRIIITTAYDNYALDAFKIHSVDYLLKPIEGELLRDAINHYRSLATPTSSATSVDYQQLATLFAPKESYKDRFLVKVGDKIVLIKVENIAYFYSENKTTFLVTDENREYIVDESLDAVECKLDPKHFFRIGRSSIISLEHIQVVTKHFGSRLKVQLRGSRRDDLFVSRARTSEFLEWLNGN
jgi:DNA-binding LytR/AlgR family response regulator